YRTAYEASRFAHFWHLLHGSDDDSYSNALDAVIVQKLMPKLHGSRAKLRPLLQDLWGACLAGAQVGVPGDPSRAIDSALYPLSADKVRRMWELLHDHGFASFAEA
ncbi:MAG: hypothetical protein K8H99_10155, partial [Nitrospirae bacterium]|nr:hypothetical protein [Fimbriimonadaceae bacterium]